MFFNEKNLHKAGTINEGRAEENGLGQRDEVIDGYIPPESLEEMWDVPALEKALEGEFAMNMPVQQWLDDDVAKSK